MLSTIDSGDTSSTYSWPEAVVGAIIRQPCPNQAGSGSRNNVSRYCTNVSSDAQWSDVDFYPCSVWVGVNLILLQHKNVN